jgi:hypothetical protein
MALAVALSSILFVAGWLVSGVALLACDSPAGAHGGFCSTIGAERSAIAIAVVPPALGLAASLAVRQPRRLLLLTGVLLLAQLSLLVVALVQAV